MAWLPGWRKRVRIPINHNGIDAALSNFPHLVYLSQSSGYNNKDVTFIFDELQSNANRKRIAITEPNGISECYVEIDKWDHLNEKAWLFTKIPDLDPDEDTAPYLYYDRTHVDNDPRVGDTRSIPAENVWDINYVFVSHMRDNPDTSHIRDSTSFRNDGTKKAAGQPAITTAGMIGDAQNFTGVSDYIDCGTDPSVLPDAFTAEFFGKTTEVDFNPVISWQHTFPLLGYPWFVSKCILYLGGSNYRYFFNNPVDVLDGNFHHIAFTAIGNAQLDIRSARMLADGQAQNPQAAVSGGLPAVKTRFWIGSTYKNLLGVYDEVRLSKIVRTDPWIKASYESGRDHLNDFGEEEIYVAPPTGGIPPLILRPPPRQTYFTKRAILLGQIRRPFSQYGSITGRIRRLFVDDVVFSATAVKHIDEEIAMGGFVVVDDISRDAWEAFFRELENEPVEEELIE